MKSRSSIIAWALIALGVLLLVNQFGIVTLGAGRVLWGALLVVGAALVIQSAWRHHRGKLFWGNVLFLFSLYFLLREFDVINHAGRTFLPAAFLAFGFSFLLLYAYEPREIARLVLGIVFLLAAGLWIGAWVGFTDIGALAGMASIYWPVVLVVLGLALLFRRRENGQSHQEGGGTTPS